MKNQIEIILRGGQYKKILDNGTAEIRKHYNLKCIEAEVLCFLKFCGDDNTSACICKRLRANKGHISKTVENLYQKGYLTAVTDKIDRRYVHYSLTEKALPVVSELHVRKEQINQELLKGINPEELEIFSRISEKIIVNMDNCI